MIPTPNITGKTSAPGLVTIPAGTDLRVPAEKYDATTERLVAEMVADAPACFKRDAAAAMRRERWEMRPYMVFNGDTQMAPVIRVGSGVAA